MQQNSVQRYDLIVVGAGIAGLNALHAALEYLPSTARVLLLDKKTRAGGMWTMAYDFVRLHQPHPMFTVGDIDWDWRRPRHYLARRGEVQAHLAGTLDQMATRAQLECRFGTTVTACSEVVAQGRPVGQVRFHPNDDPVAATTAQADLVVRASGFDYAEAPPLPLESAAVLSIAPSQLSATLAAHPGAPVVVVGGGKTGMDCVTRVLDQGAGHAVTLINGRGTHFLDRTRVLPNGLARWTSGTLVARLFRDLALRFDGQNDAVVIDRVREAYAVDPQGRHGAFVFGILSQGEWQRLQAGLAETLPGYLEEVTDTPEGPQLHMRDGTRRAVAPGTIFVNCTGSFFRSDRFGDDTPILSPGGVVLGINPRSAFQFLSTASAFFSLHLHYRGKLRGQGFYQLDHETLFRRDRTAWVAAAAAQSYLNFTLGVRHLPMSVLVACGVNFDRWFPMPRQTIGLLQMLSTASADIAHCTAALDQVQRRFDTGCRPIT